MRKGLHNKYENIKFLDKFGFRLTLCTIKLSSVMFAFVVKLCKSMVNLTRVSPLDNWTFKC